MRTSRFFFVSGVLSFLLFVTSEIITINIEINKWISLGRVSIITVSALCYLFCYYSSTSVDNYKRQFSWINLVVFVFHIIYSAVFLKPIYIIHYRSQFYMEVVWILVCIIVLWHSRNEIAKTIAILKNKEELFYVILATAFASALTVVSYDVRGPRFVWDAGSFYDRMSQLETIDAFDISKFFIFSHVDVTYFYSVFMLSKLFNSLRMGFYAYNSFCLVAASFGTVFLLKNTLITKNRFFISIASFACLFSPYICGTSTHYTYDFSLCCLCPILFLFAVKKDWMYFASLGMYISLMKETGFVFVGCVCVSIVLVELLYDKSSVKEVLLRKRTVGWGVIAGTFMFFYMRFSKWQGEYQVGGFGYDIGHIITTLKMFLVLNFVWIVILLVAITLLIHAIQKKIIDRYVVTYIIPAGLLLLFYLGYVTYEFPRYTGCFQICISLASIGLLASVPGQTYIERLILPGWALIEVVSCFFSIDPLSAKLFTTADTGKGMVYFSRQDFDFGGDPCVYNRQYYGLQIVYEDSLKKAIDSGDSMIAVSTGNYTKTWPIDGGFYAYNENIDKRYFTEFWNIKENLREASYDQEFFSDPNYRTFDIRFVYSCDDTVSALQEKDSFIYIYLPSLNGEREEIVRNNFRIIEEGSFDSHGWIMAYIRGSKQ